MDEIIWGITYKDVKEVIDERFPLLSEKEKEKLIERATQQFDIKGWADIVDKFLITQANELFNEK